MRAACPRSICSRSAHSAAAARPSTAGCPSDTPKRMAKSGDENGTSRDRRFPCGAHRRHRTPASPGHQPGGTCVRSHPSSRRRSAATATSFAVDVRPCVRGTPPSCPGRVRRDGYRGSAPAAPPAPRRRLRRAPGEAGSSWPCLWSPRRSSRARNDSPCAGGVLEIEVRKTRAFRVTAPVFLRDHRGYRWLHGNRAGT